MNQFKIQFALTLLLCLGMAPLVSAQQLPPGATWDRTSIEEGYLNEFSLNRTVLGPRSKAMGRSGLSLLAGVEYHSLNPASIIGVQRLQIFSEGIYMSGSATEGTVPTYMDEVDTEWSEFNIRPGTDFGYGGISVGMPIQLLGARGAFAVSYSRQRQSPLPEEYRQEAIGALTENTPSTVGVRKRPSGGYDVLTLTAARRVMDKIDLGLNMNYESGWVRDKSSIDVSVFGRPAAAEKRTLEQDYSSLNFDLGARSSWGPFSGGISYFFGHHIDYENGTVNRTPLYIIGDQNPITFSTSLVDHSLAVPSRIGLGGAYEWNDKVTLTADYWTQGWSNASFSRKPLDSFYTFADMSDSASFFHFLVPGEGADEIINAEMSDISSFRMGVEYYLVDQETLRIPVRFGYRKDGLTQAQVDVNVDDGKYSDYLDLLEAYRLDVLDNVVDGENERILRDFLEHGSFVHRSNKEVTSTTISFGGGLEIRELAIDFSFDVQKADAARYFNSSFSPQWWPYVYGMDGTRSISTFSLGARLVF